MHGANINLHAEDAGGTLRTLLVCDPDAQTIGFGTHSAIGAETVTGYITIQDAGGTSRKVAIAS